MDTIFSGAPADNTVTDLGLRLVASTVTTFLILALLLFLIHRFRQRRLLMTLRSKFNPLLHRYSFLRLLQQTTFENIVIKDEIAVWGKGLTYTDKF